MKRHPWLAAILNFVLPGAGYIYVGTRVRFGVLLIAAMVLVIFGPAPENSETVATDTATMLADPAMIVMLISGLMIASAFAYDAYLDAKALTGKKKTIKKKTKI